MLITSKKHWIVYFGFILKLLLGVVILNLHNFSKIIPEPLKFLDLAIGGWIIFQSVKGLIASYYTSWSFENDILTIKYGFLPWNKTFFNTDTTQIFEAYYNNHFFGTIFGFANIKVRRTDGVTSHLSETYMTNHKIFVSDINEAISNSKQNDTDTDTKLNQMSITDEIRELASLKSEGLLSEVEYEMLKNKLINES